MSTTILQPNVETNEVKGKVVYEGGEKKTSPGLGAAFILPDQAGFIDSWLLSLVMQTPGASGLIQYTISDRAAVLSDRAYWYNWDAGTVNENTNDVLYPVVAVRQRNISGTTKIEVRAV